jgi:hypothetical protein
VPTAASGKTLPRLLVYCADIGSVKTGKFGWARLDVEAEELRGGDDIGELAAGLAADLNDARPVALGFECPLFVPLPAEPQELGGARPNEGNRAWSAGAGAGSMAVGLAEVPWILRRVAASVDGVEAYLEWSEFRDAGRGLFLWEAFVTDQAKGLTHKEDAAIGAEAFRDALEDPPKHDALGAGEAVFSLIGAALLATGWRADREALSAPCLVIRAKARTPAEVVAD